LKLHRNEKKIEQQAALLMLPWINQEVYKHLLRHAPVRLSVCLVWRWWKLILIELSLSELILVKSEFDVNWLWLDTLT